MPTWNEKTKKYEEDLVNDLTTFEAMKREERFRTALLNELDALTTAVNGLDGGDGFRVTKANNDY